MMTRILEMEMDDLGIVRLRVGMSVQEVMRIIEMCVRGLVVWRTVRNVEQVKNLRNDLSEMLSF